MDISVVHPCHLSPTRPLGTLPKYDFEIIFRIPNLSVAFGEGLSIPLPLVIINSGQLLEAVLGDNRLAHRAGLHNRKAIAALTDFL